jgi:hypothetical protein
VTEQSQFDFDKKSVIPRLDRGIQEDLDSCLRRNDNLTFEEEFIWEAIKLHRGKDDPILGPVITEVTKIDYDRVRQTIAHLINHHGYLIVSNSKGYFVPVTVNEIFEATRSLRHRGIMILVRAAKLSKVSLEEIFHQGRMEFDER